MGKGNGKRKRERVSQLAGPGGVFGPAERERARGRVGRRPTRPTSGGDDVGTAPWRGPTYQGEGGRLTARNGDREGKVGRGSTADEIPRRFSTVGLVL
jgi:hypothetical protein